LDNFGKNTEFNVLDLNCAPDGSILVSTDKNRAILFQINSSIQKRNFYGFISDDWSIPRAIFSHDGSYVYLTSQDYKVYIYSTINEKLVHHLEGHTAIVRDLSMHPTKNILITCSYDKTVKIWE